MAGFKNSGVFGVKASTPAAGFALQNGTPTILSYTTPNDGNMHLVQVMAAMVVSVLEVGGSITWSATPPTGTIAATPLFNSALGVGTYQGNNNAGALVGIAGPNTTVSIQQTAALTSGTAILYAVIVGD